jgi:hypothetical protein
METLRELADVSIRRACAFATLGIATVMLALSYDLVLALRCGGLLTGLVSLGLALAAWRAPRKDVRRTELWSLLAGTSGEALVRALPQARAQALLAEVLRERLLWHADRAAGVALALGVPGTMAALLR